MLSLRPVSVTMGNIVPGATGHLGKQAAIAAPGRTGFILPLQRDRVRFGEDKPVKPDTPKPETLDLPPLKKPAFWYRPFIKMAAVFYTQPNLVKKYLPSEDHMLDPKHLYLYQPIHPVGFKSPDGIALQGYWMPSDTPSNKMVVLGHGYTHDWREMLAIAQPLRDKGYNCFLFDFRAHGASGGDTTSIGFHEAKDLASAVNFAKETYPEQARHLFYMGHSMGGAAMMMAPKSLEGYPEVWTKLNKNLDGIILDAPYYNFREIAERFIKGIASLEPDSWLVQKLVAPVVMGKMGDKIVNGLQWMVKDYLKLPVDIFAMIGSKSFAASTLGQKPILLLHGNADFVTPYNHGQRVFEELKAKNPTRTKFITLEGAEHLNRQWYPVPEIKESFWTAQRSDMKMHLENFLAENIPQSTSNAEAASPETSGKVLLV